MSEACGGAKDGNSCYFKVLKSSVERGVPTVSQNVTAFEANRRWWRWLRVIG
jgi:hypothetical protein